MQLKPELAQAGIKLEVKGENVSCSAITAETPFLDPTKEKRSKTK